MLLGHEGAGIVEEVGDGVETPVVGDPVVLAWAVPCGSCGPCRRGVPRRCSHAWTQPPRVRRARDAAPLSGTLSLGTLATHTVVHAAQAIPMPTELPLRSGCLLGCGVSTGVGAATQTAKVWPGARVAVIGLGGIGLAALQGARIAGRRAADRRGHRGAEAGLGEAVRGDRHRRCVGRRRRRGGSRAHRGRRRRLRVRSHGRPTGGVPGGRDARLRRSRGGDRGARRSPRRSPSRGTAPSTPPTHGRRRCSSPTAATPIPSEDFPEMARWALDGRLDLDGDGQPGDRPRRARRSVPRHARRRGDPLGRGVRRVTETVDAPVLAAT